MEISLADERALLLKGQLSMDQAEGRAWSSRIDAFGRMAKMGSFLSKPKDDDFQLIYKEHRLEPFWHIVCRAKYVYEKHREFPLELTGGMVEKVTINGQEYVVQNGRLTLMGTEHCREEPEKETFVDAYTSQENPELQQYLTYPANEIPTSYLDELSEQGIIVVPPQARASAIVRNVLVTMMRQIQADRVIEDNLEIERVDLYYRPVFAFEYRWLSREKDAILEYDGLTGQLEAGGKTFQQYMGKLLDPEFLFDVGVDTVDLFVPGGGLAVKLAKRSIDVVRKRTG